MPRHDIKNQIIQRLSQDDYEALVSRLKIVNLALKQVLLVPGEPLSHVYFIESGMVSLIAEADVSEAIDVGPIGNEGMTDQVLEVGDSALLKGVVRMPGLALAITAADYARWIADRPSPLKLLTRYVKSMTVQIACTALSHGSFNVGERLARCLLMSFDRTGGEDLQLAHHFLSIMLDVRRSGVTTALHVIEGHGAIKATRCHIRLRDRATLVALAAGSYGHPEREYARLMGSPPRRDISSNIRRPPALSFCDGSPSLSEPTGLLSQHA